MERLIRFLAALTRWGLGACALLAVLVALYVSLGRELIPLVAEYRSDVEAKAEQSLGLPVHVGALEGRWSGLAPILVVRDVQVGEGASALRLDAVKVVPDLWASLVARDVRLARVELGGLQVNLHEDESGKWTLKGLPVQDDDQPLDVEQALRRMQVVSKVSVLDSQVTLEPFDHDPVTLTYVGLSLQTGSVRQRLDARLTLPDGQPLALSLKSRIRPAQWREAEVEAYASLPQSDWAKWLPARLLGQWQLPELRAGGEVWLNWGQGKVQSATLRLHAPQLQGAYAERQPIRIDNLALNAWLRRGDEGLRLTIDSLAMNLGETRWESHVQISQSSAGEDGELWQIQADRVDLTPLTPVIQALGPLPKQAMAVVDGLKVTGGLRNVLLEVRPQVEGDRMFSFAANLDRVGFDAYHGAPAAGNVSGSIAGDLGHGELRLDTDKFMLHLVPIFADPWHYLKANARLTWKLDKETFTLIAPYLKVLGEEGKIAGDFLIRLHLAPGHEDYMDLRVGLVEGDGRYTGKYLPEVLSPDVDHWLRTAILKGAVDEGYFQYQGSLNHGAPDHARSISLFFKVRDADLDFQPGWPQLNQVDGDVFIDDHGVRIVASTGQMLNTKVSNVLVDIPHVPAGEHSHLFVDGDFDGTLADGVKILQQAPIGTASPFAGWEGEGDLKGSLKLDIPLAHGTEPKVVVDFRTEQSRLKISEPVLELSALKGDFRFDLDQGLSGKNISTVAFGKPVTAEIFAEGKPGQMQTRVVAKGQIALKSLTDWLQFKQPLPVSGELPYQLQVSLGRDNQLSVDSSLKGLLIDLPAPFGKAASDTRTSQFRMNLGGSERRVDATYDGLASLAMAAPAGKTEQVRGELVLGGGAAQLPGSQGLRVRGKLAEVNLDDWQSKASSYTGDDPGGSARQILRGVDLSVDKIKAYNFELNQAVVRLDRNADNWGLRLDSQEVIGNARIPDAKAAPIVVDLPTLRLPPADPADATAPEAPDPLAATDPRKVPSVNVNIGKLFRGDDLLGSLSLKLRPTARGVAFNDLDLNLKGLAIDGSAGWEGVPGASSSWYKGRLQGGDLAEVLKAWGFAATVTSREFHMDADGRWQGSPAWVSLKRFSGSMDASLRDGQIVEVDGSAQALRVFGLLNFNSIGRRLRLDFSDLLGKGLSYDRVKGVLVASEGVYVTREPITVTGPSSNFELEGTLDLVRDRVAANLMVTLPVTNNLPLAALIVGAPAVGGALFLVDKLLGDRVARYASVNYRVEGPVKEPKITFVKPFDKSR